MVASLLQLAGLVAVAVGAALVAGVGGLVLGGGLALVYVGLAVDRGRT
jgi:hypothetical protein